MHRLKNWALRSAVLGALSFSSIVTLASPLDSCQGFLLAARAYSKEIIESRGLRLLAKSENPVDTRYRRFLSPVSGRSAFLPWLLTEMPVRLFTGIENRRMTPIAGLYFSFVQKPMADFTEWVGLGRLEPTWPVMALLGALAWQGADRAGDAANDAKIWSQIYAHQSTYDEFLNYDFRFHDIRDRFEQQKISMKEARLESYWRKLAIDKYYSDREKTGSIQDLSIQRLYLKFFTDLDRVVKNGVRPSAGYLVPSSAQGPLSDSQILRLIEVNHHLYDQYQIVVELVHDSKLFHELENGAFANQVHNELADPFTKKILSWLKAGILSVDEAQVILQEDAFWQARFQEWKILGVTKLKISKQGQLTASPLALEDIRDEMLQSYLERRKTSVYEPRDSDQEPIPFCRRCVLPV